MYSALKGLVGTEYMEIPWMPFVEAVVIWQQQLKTGKSSCQYDSVSSVS